MAVGQVVSGIFYWNVGAAVGAGQPNRLDDVELVRFGFVMMRSANDIHRASPQLRAALQELRRTGGFDRDLDAAIRALQAQMKTPADGKVSVAQVSAANHGRYDGHHMWIIWRLNEFMRDFDLYPRIDLHPDSGLEIYRVALRLREY